jgi:hypothetical protein
MAADFSDSRGSTAPPGNQNPCRANMAPIRFRPSSSSSSFLSPAIDRTWHTYDSHSQYRSPRAAAKRTWHLKDSHSRHLRPDSGLIVHMTVPQTF